MKKLFLTLPLIVMTLVVFSQGQPVISTKITGKVPVEKLSNDPNRYPVLPGNSLMWSQGPGCGAVNISSEIISEFGLVSNGADDFIFNENKLLTGIRWWFVIDTYSPITYWTITIYDDNSCLPGNVLQTWIIPFDQSHEQFYCSFLTTNSYWNDLTPTLLLSADTRYWISIQAGDHVFPGQWYWDGIYDISGCNGTFKSAFFGYPQYTPMGRDFSFDLFGTDSAPQNVPISNWALFIGIGLILVAAAIRFRRIL
jgi:hypothetical protein